MRDAYFILMACCGGLCVIAAIAHFASIIILQFFIDHERVKEETGEPGWKIVGSIMAPPEFYKPAARPLWNVRRISWKLVWIALGATFVVVILGSIVERYRSS